MSDRKLVNEALNSDAAVMGQGGRDKRNYKAPILTKFGSVRDPTGGDDSGNTLDANNVMTMLP
jgi:hypothetical protein